MSKGFFLVVGGIGGSGKTTLCKAFAKYFEEQGIDHITTFEPGGTPAANYLRKLCREGLPGCEELTPMAQAMLFNAARAQHVEKVIRPALAEGKVVICDRYVETTYAYQGAAMGVSIFNLSQVHHYGIGLDPDLTFIIQGDEEVFMARLSPEEKLTDKFDSMAIAVQSRMQDYFEYLITRDDSRAYEGIDGEGTPEEAFAEALPHLEKIVKKIKEERHTETLDTSSTVDITKIVPGKIEFRGI